MYEILLDVNGWQGLFDFQTGSDLSLDNKSYIKLASDIAARHPYPGDLNIESIKWTTDVALDIATKYNPQLMVLSYANCEIMRVNSKLSSVEVKDIESVVLNEAFRFAKEANYEPIIVSTGDMEKIENLIDMDEVEGYYNVSSDFHIAGIFGATEKDYETVQTLCGVEKHETRHEFVEKFQIEGQYALDRTPDIILYSKEGYSFTNTGNRGTTLEARYKMKKTTKVYTELNGLKESIFDFRAFVDEQLSNGKRIAVIVVEGIDDEMMPNAAVDINKYEDGIYYSEGVLFYYALLNGKRFNSFGMPYLYHNPFIKKTARDRYPYSYIKTNEYQNPIGLNREFKTASMGTRSGIFHSACMCDYSFECHCRGLAESGFLTFINSEKLGGEI